MSLNWWFHDDINTVRSLSLSLSQSWVIIGAQCSLRYPVTVFPRLSLTLTLSFSLFLPMFNRVRTVNKGSPSGKRELKRESPGTKSRQIILLSYFLKWIIRIPSFLPRTLICYKISLNCHPPSVFVYGSILRMFSSQRVVSHYTSHLSCFLAFPLDIFIMLCTVCNGLWNL